jgi:2,3,4,5-tetrahydropyridine-2,6-dicarboxylate N-succinyltransferase
MGMGVYIGQSTKIYDRATGEVSYGRVPSRLGGGQRQPAQAADGSLQPVLRGDRQAVDAQTRAKTSINELLRA